jgi:hypothetical protein
MQIRNVDFLLTFRCPAKCKHCSYKAGPERRGYMKLKDAKSYLEELTDTQPLQSITVHGGEPFLYFEHLKEIIEKAGEVVVPRRGVITNGYWAKTKEIAKKKLVELKRVGLTCITFSLDSFHQEYIPLEIVKTGIETAANIGFDRVCVDSYFLAGIDSDNFYDTLTREALESLRGLDEVEVHRYRVSFEGRGAELARHVKLREDLPSGKCPLRFWIDGTLKNPETIEIDFEGNVTLCPGICIGNTKRQPLTQLLQSYNCHMHPILSIIAEKGPVGLLEIAEEKGFKQRKFVDECHLCYELRKYLRAYYPQFLTPVDCY